MPRITIKGQVTLPKEVRDDLGLKPGSSVTFKKVEGAYLIIKEDTKDGDDYLSKWVGKGEPLIPGQTVDEMIDDMRGGTPRDRRGF